MPLPPLENDNKAGHCTRTLNTSNNTNIPATGNENHLGFEIPSLRRTYAVQNLEDEAEVDKAIYREAHEVLFQAARTQLLQSQQPVTTNQISVGKENEESRPPNQPRPVTRSRIPIIKRPNQPLHIPLPDSIQPQTQNQRNTTSRTNISSHDLIIICDGVIKCQPFLNQNTQYGWESVARHCDANGIHFPLPAMTIKEKVEALVQYKKTPRSTADVARTVANIFEGPYADATKISKLLEVIERQYDTMKEPLACKEKKSNELNVGITDKKRGQKRTWSQVVKHEDDPARTTTSSQDFALPASSSRPGLLPVSSSQPSKKSRTDTNHSQNDDIKSIIQNEFKTTRETISELGTVLKDMSEVVCNAMDKMTNVK